MTLSRRSVPSTAGGLLHAVRALAPLSGNRTVRDAGRRCDECHDKRTDGEPKKLARAAYNPRTLRTSAEARREGYARSLGQVKVAYRSEREREIRQTPRPPACGAPPRKHTFAAL